MTVEQCTYGPTSRAATENNVLKQITEITRIADTQRIKQAISECTDKKGSYQINDVINYLLGDDVEPGNPSSAVNVTSVDKAVTTVDLTTETAASASASNSTDETIDLTAAGDTELDRAVAESLRDVAGGLGILGGQVTREDEEISKVLERSLVEDTKLGTKRKRGDLWFVDPLNPHDRMRTGLWPVGLKNVGNTCWFSAVVQSLFHLPVFRKLVLRFVQPKVTTDDNSRVRNHQFMTELRHLFALMVASKRRYVDPSGVIDILKEAFSSGANSSVSSTDNQQDVSEFQHKLLDWLEDAFRVMETTADTGNTAALIADNNTRNNNPVVKLFYGQYLSAGINEGTSFEKKDLFGQLPLQVDGFNDIHESLEAATAQGEIETLTDGDNASRSCQEQWFVHLPPVLTFELSRFQFNKNLARPEKIHNQFDFPQQIYMDRYLERNHVLTRQKRDESKKLRETLRDLQCRLDRFVNYGSGSKRFPIQDVLQYALEFAQSHGTVSSPTSRLTVSPSANQVVSVSHPIVEQSSSPPCCTSSAECSVTRSNSSHRGSSDIEMESPRSQNVSMEFAGSPVRVDETVAAASVLTSVSAAASGPAPRNVTTDELRVLQTCLTRWRTEVEQDVKDLQRQIGLIEDRLAVMYSDPELTKCGYRLHAVLVHEGQAASGHYWAYVYCPTLKEWLKFNDVAVDIASWEDILKDGIGGYHNTSAYCIMYVNDDHMDLQQLSCYGDEMLLCDVTSRDTESDRLLSDLQTYVNDDNAKFEAEIVAWDYERSSRRATSDNAILPLKADVKVPVLPVKAVTAGRSLLADHLQLFITETRQLASSIAESCKENSVDKAMHMGYNELIIHAKSCKADLSHASLVKSDERLRDVLVYFIINNAEDVVIERTFLEKLHLGLELETCDAGAKKLLETVSIQLGNFALQSSVEALCEKWHEIYRRFRQTVFAFVNGVRIFHANSFTEALPWFVEACRLSETMISVDSNLSPYLTLDFGVLSYYRRQCLLRVNEAAVEQFKNDEHKTELLTELNQLFLPCFYALVCSKDAKDSETVAAVRQSWCEILCVELSVRKREMLTDFLTLVLDATEDSVSQQQQQQQQQHHHHHHQCIELLQYREVGDQLMKDFNDIIQLATDDGSIDAVSATDN